MIFSWLTERRRRHILEHPFPDAWTRILEARVGFWPELAPDEQARLRDLVQVFIAEKRWEGCGGLELTDEVRVTVAAEACLLLLGRDHSLYDRVESILIYPSTVMKPQRPPGIFAAPSAEPVGHPVALLGEAHHGGPVILVWDAVERGAGVPHDGRNVVFHEFAHMIDMREGDANGTPPLDDRSARRTWALVSEAAFLALREAARRGHRTLLDSYGATSEAEFFAVATECFFERPVDMERELPDLYALLGEFYLQDPAARRRRRTA